jgi:hypothetical protein
VTVLGLPADAGRTAPRSRSDGERIAVEVDACAPAAWDATLAGFDDASWEQTACWTEARWGGRRSSHLLVRRGGVPIGGARVVVFRVPVLRRGLAWVKFGPFWRRHGTSPEPAVYRAVAGALVDEYCGRRGHCLAVIPRPSPDHHADEIGMLGGLGFVARRPVRDPNRYLVDLALPRAERLASLDQKWRYNLRQALRSGVECRAGDDAAGLAAFADLHARMIARKRFDDPAGAAVLGALGTLPAAMRPRAVLALHQGRPVAGAVVALCGDVAYYVFGASDDTALPLKAGYALQWWIVEWLSALGVRWYDLGGEAGEPGLRQFKKGLVGKRGTVLVMPGELEHATRPAARLAADAIHRVRELHRRARGLRRR